MILLYHIKSKNVDKEFKVERMIAMNQIIKKRFLKYEAVFTTWLMSRRSYFF